MNGSEHTTPTDLATARTEAERLTTLILDARDQYYGADRSLVDDETYDGWMHALEAIEQAFPELAGQDSPTQTVGAAENSMDKVGKAADDAKDKAGQALKDAGNEIQD